MPASGEMRLFGSEDHKVATGGGPEEDVMHLGIDLGTSAVKVCLLGHDRAVVATSSAALGISHPLDGASEQDCGVWCELIER